MADARTQATTIGKGLYLIFFNKNNRANFLGPVLRRPINANPGLYFNPRFFSFYSKAFSVKRWPISANTTNSSWNTTKYSWNTTNNFPNTKRYYLNTAKVYRNTTRIIETQHNICKTQHNFPKTQHRILVEWPDKFRQHYCSYSFF